jgi:mycothiol synthase
MIRKTIFLTSMCGALLGPLAASFCGGQAVSAQQPGIAAPGQYDIVIANGTIIDGTGAPRYRGDIAIVGDRVVRVSCEGSGHHFKDPRGANYHSESPVMLCKTAKDGLIKLRLDMISDRPHAMTNYQLQGTDGAYESSRGGPGDRDKIWLRVLSREPRWFDLWTLAGMDEFADKYMPEIWRNPPEAARRAGHGGGDYFEVLDFINAVRGVAPCPIGIHEAMDMTLPGLASQQSILEGGRWVWVPDSRKWTGDGHEGQLHMVWPQRLIERAPEPAVPEGYELRQFQDADTDAYLAIMHRTELAHWDRKGLSNVRQGVLPGGFFIIIHKPSGAVVGSAQARHGPSELHPEGGEVGWVVADPDHKGKQLGMIATAAAARRLLRAGYRHVYLSTDDWRLPACKSYLKLGFEPMMYKDDMPARWKAVMEKLGWEANR